METVETVIVFVGCLCPRVETRGNDCFVNMADWWIGLAGGEGKGRITKGGAFRIIMAGQGQHETQDVAKQ